MSKHDNDYDEYDNIPDNEFELEITDLPRDEEAGRSVALVAEGLRVLSKVRDTSHDMVEQGKQRLEDTREWLLEEEPQQRMLEQTADSEFEMEIVNLPPELGQSNRWVQIMEQLRTRIPFNRRLKRLSLALAIILLLFIFLLSSLPDVRTAIANFFVHPVQTPTSDNSFLFFQDNNNGGIQVLTGVTVIPQGTVTTQHLGLTPGPKWPLPPAAMPTNCPPGPVVNQAQTVGSTPVWITGFSGPRAVIHLPDTPSRSIPEWHGWAVHLAVTVPTDYQGSITITGSDILYGRILFFQVDPDPTLTPILTLNPAHPTGLHSIVDGQQGDSWNVTMYVYSSGCYVINTAWQDGEWNFHFAAGL